MPVSTFKKLLTGTFGALSLEDLFPHRIRKLLLRLFFAVSVLFLLAILFVHGPSEQKIQGAFFISLSIVFGLFMLESYFYAVFARAGRGDYKVSFEIARVIFYAEDADLTKGFAFSDLGDETFQRLGFSEKEIKAFLGTRPAVSFESIIDTSDNDLPLELYAKTIFKNDKALEDLLFTKGLGEKEFVGAMRWVVEKDFLKTEKERWWSRESLGRIPGLGKNWAYGETYLLERYGEDLTEEDAPFEGSYEKANDAAVTRLEGVLARGHGANAVVVSDDETSRSDVVKMLARRIVKGNAIVPLQHKRVFLLNPNLLVEQSSDKLSFERNFTDVLVQSARAGNVILAIPYFSSFIKSAAALSSDVIAVLAPYATSPALHIIALDSMTDYHGFLATKETVSTNFEMIQAGLGSDEGLVEMLEDEANEIEKHARILFTYPALKAIAESAKRYFELSAVVSKAKDLLLGAPAVTFAAGRKMVLKEDVMQLVATTTGIPTAAPVGEERRALMHLEDMLHERIVGQNEAVKAVAEALKRSRAGVRNPDKPIGTFLFLGPTGVGKTETTKALADIMFGSEERMSRLDMSEYRDSYAEERLIGSFGNGKAGTLPTLLREKPYGVLLLDEFEKTTTSIIDLFLRLFDEGTLTDAEGRAVNAKNNIIIATSNAGSELIWEIVKNGGDLEAKKSEVIEEIVKSGVFKPELLNRFDAVVLFHPLLKPDLTKIAELMMKRFEKRMREKGIAVEITDGAIEYLVSKGTDPKFGARPLNRAIDDEVEKLIAEKLIDGTLVSGSKVLFDKEGDGTLAMKIK